MNGQPPRQDGHGKHGQKYKKKQQQQEPNQGKPKNETKSDQPNNKNKGKNKAYAPRDANPPRQNNRNNQPYPNRNNHPAEENHQHRQPQQHNDNRVSEDVLKFCESLKKKQFHNKRVALTTDHDLDMWKRSIEVAATPMRSMNQYRLPLLKVYQELPDLGTYTPAAVHMASFVRNLLLSRQRPEEVVPLLFDIVSTRLRKNTSLSTIRSPQDKKDVQKLWTEITGFVLDNFPDDDNLQQEIHDYVSDLRAHKPVAAESETKESIETVEEGWFNNPTVGWLADGKWLTMRGLKNHYTSVDEYIATMRELWTTLTFCLGAAALWPKCRCPGPDTKPCNAPLMTRVTSTGQTCSMKVRRQGHGESFCGQPAAWRCSRNRHDLICEQCLAAKKALLRGPRDNDHNASTDVYDAEIQWRSLSGESDILTLCKLQSRKPPREGTNWRTSYRLQSPNLVGVVVLNTSNETLNERSRLYFGEIVPHDRLKPGFEAARRTSGFLDVRLLSQPDASVMRSEMSLPPTVEKGCCVAVIDMQVFVPEVFSVLSTLTDKSFKEGLQKVPFGNFLLNGAPPEPLRFSNPNDHARVIGLAIERSSLRSIRQLTEEQRVEFFRTLLDMPTVRSLDQTQLQAFAYGLSCDLHCTQGPPGTGKVQ